MTLTEKQFQQLCALHTMSQNDAQDALDFVYDLLQSEARAIRTAEPSAVNSINRLEIAAREAYCLASDLSAENFNEV